MQEITKITLSLTSAHNNASVRRVKIRLNVFHYHVLALIQPAACKEGNKSINWNMISITV